MRAARRVLAFALASGALLAAASASGCAGPLARNFGPTRRLARRVDDPVRPDARLAVLWVGHATVLVQMDDRFVLTDPVFTDTVGVLSRRLVEPGIDPARLPPIDAIVISHVHFDHLSLGSIDMLRDKTRAIVVPSGARPYVPDAPTPLAELAPWRSWEKDGLRVTAVPVRHVGWRYGVDAAWMTSFTGYVIEYRGQAVYFGGDTAYDPALFRAAAARFPRIDLALLPIAPIHPRDFMRHTHMDPFEAVRAMLDLRAARMVPIHFDTFVNSLDAPGEPAAVLARAARGARVEDRVLTLAIGEQRVVVPAAPAAVVAGR